LPEATPTSTTDPGVPEVETTKTDDGMSVAAGGGITYTLTYTKAGAQIAMGMIITETVPDYTTFSAAASTPDWSSPDGSPAGTVCTFPVGDLVPGGGGSVRFVVTTDDPLPEGATEILNTASIGEDEDCDGDTCTAAPTGTPTQPTASAAAPTATPVMPTAMNTPKPAPAKKKTSAPAPNTAPAVSIPTPEFLPVTGIAGGTAGLRCH